ncbi:cytochrome P450 27C1-like [Oncorhynchus tshawytscha]|uniref:cytochrome P450 27C1-like n=1 Tax=Oncorhynchus tshawytscha TaxID=74940 RepID=UPI001C3C9AA1|nr:cytochrome P450 27C1-like [Oncorhynchus tshawytscha]
MFPVLPGNGRVTQDDLVVGGYFIPKGTQLALCHYSTSMDEENFPGADDFRPDRWIRKDATDRVDNSAPSRSATASGAASAGG